MEQTQEQQQQHDEEKNDQVIQGVTPENGQEQQELKENEVKSDSQKEEEERKDEQSEANNVEEQQSKEDNEQEEKDVKKEEEFKVEIADDSEGEENVNINDEIVDKGIKDDGKAQGTSIGNDDDDDGKEEKGETGKAQTKKYKEGDVYKHEESGFEIKPPAGWYLTAEDKGTAVFAASEKEDSAQLNVILQQVGPDMTLQDFTSMSKSQLEDRTGIPILTRNEALAGMDGVRCEYMISNPYSDSDDDARGIYQAWCLYHGVAFIITFTAALQGTNKCGYRDLFSAAKRAIDSFSLENATVSFQNFYSTVFLYRRKLPPGMGAAIYLPASWTASQEVRKSAFFPEKEPQEIAHFEFNGKLDEDPDSLPLCMRLTVTADRLPDGVTLDRYTDMVYRQLRMIRAQSVSLLRRKFVLGGLPADFCIFETRDVVREGGRFFHMWTVKDRRAYVLALAISSTDPDEKRPFEMFARIAANFAFDGDKERAEATRKLGVYENFEKRFGICFPESFSGKDNYMGNTVSFFSKDAMSAVADVTTTTLNVIFEELGSENVTLDNLCETLKSQIDGQGSCRIVNEIMSDYKILGAPVKCISYILEIDSECLKFVQYASIAKESSYAVVISFGSDENRFEAEFRKLGIEKCINSVYVF